MMNMYLIKLIHEKRGINQSILMKIFKEKVITPQNVSILSGAKMPNIYTYTERGTIDKECPFPNLQDGNLIHDSGPIFIKNNDKLTKLINKIKSSTSGAKKLAKTLKMAKTTVVEARASLKDTSAMFDELEIFYKETELLLDVLQ